MTNTFENLPTNPQILPAYILNDIPDEIKRGFIGAKDSAMVHYIQSSGAYCVRFSNNAYTKSYIANMYYKSNLFLRILSRLADHGPTCRFKLAAHELCMRNDSLLRGEITWVQAFEGFFENERVIRKELKKHQRFIIRCHEVNKASGYYFNTDQLVRSYCMEILQIPDCLVYCRVLPEVAKKDILLKFQEKNEIDEEACSAAEFARITDMNAEWVYYLHTAVASVRPSEKFAAIKMLSYDLVDKHGADYNFLIKACNDMLI